MSQNIHQENLAEIDRLTTDLQTSIIKNTRKVLVGQDINFTGELSKSIEPDVDRSTGQKIVKITSPYGVAVEFGMPAGIRVHFDSLKKWVEGKLGVPPSISEDVTRKIWYKILNKGIKPTRFFKKGIKMTISDHGILNMRTNTRHNNSNIIKILNKLAKYSKWTSRATRKSTRSLGKLQKSRKRLMRNVNR